MTAPGCSGRESVLSVSKRESIGRGRAGAFGGVESRHDQTEPGHVWRSEERPKAQKGRRLKCVGYIGKGSVGWAAWALNWRVQGRG